MAKVFGPCLSILAKGSIRKSITFQKRPSGVAAIKPPIPAKKRTRNPTAAQAASRAVFKNLVKAWQALTAAQKSEWQDEADWVGSGLSGFLQFMRAGTGLPFVVALDVLGFYEGDPKKRNFLLGSGLLN